MRVAAIDLGSNTFHLLIAERDEGLGFRTIHQARAKVQLGEGGFSSSTLQTAAMDRAVDALRSFLNDCKTYKAELVKAVATSAVRDASNKRDFLERIHRELALQIDVVSGNREAELIYSGTNHFCQHSKSPVLIIDIGGGSTEFILAAQNEGILWKKSYQIGVARLKQRFQPSEPIIAEEIEAIESLFETEFGDLQKAIKKHSPLELIGASGSFESFGRMLSAQNQREWVPTEKQPFNQEQFKALLEKLIKQPLNERLGTPGLSDFRAAFIVMGGLITQYLLQLHAFAAVRYSEYALKEGLVLELLNTRKHGYNSGN